MLKVLGDPRLKLYSRSKENPLISNTVNVLQMQYKSSVAGLRKYAQDTLQSFIKSLQHHITCLHSQTL